MLFSEAVGGSGTKFVSLWPIACGALAVLGSFWLVVYALVSIWQHGGDWPAYAGHGAAAVVVGGLVCGATPRRPVGDAACAGALGIGLMAVLFIAAPEPNFSWLAARSSHPLLIAGAIALGTAGGAGATAAIIGKRLPPRLTGLSLACLLSLATLGGLLTAAHIAFGFFGVRL